MILRNALLAATVFVSTTACASADTSGDTSGSARADAAATGAERERIARFSEVETCYLMSGAYDLLVIVHGKTLHSVASFVAARLSSIEGVLSTATHFMLKVYKEQGHMFERDQQDPDKLQVSP